MELEALQAVYAEIRAAGANLVAISPQNTQYSANIVRKHGLEFPVLCDAGNRVAKLFGLTFAFPDELRQAYLGFGADISRFNGDDSWTLPLSSRFVAATDGRIVDMQADPDYTVRPEPSELIDILAKLG